MFNIDHSPRRFLTTGRQTRKTDSLLAKTGDYTQNPCWKVSECNGDITTTNRTQRRPHSAIIIAHIKQSHSIYALCHSRGSELLTYFMNDLLPNLVFKEFWTHRWQFGMQPSRVTIPLLRWE